MGLLIEVVNHLRLSWRLFWDKRVHWWQRAIFVIPLVYLFIPFRYDLLADLMPLIGLLDDALLFLLCTYVFAALCPRRVVREHRGAIRLSDPDPAVRERARTDLQALEALSAAGQLEMYRHPRESVALVLGLTILVGLAAVGGLLVGAILFLSLGLSYLGGRMAHGRMLGRATLVDGESYPRVQASLERCFARLPYVPVDVFVVPSSHLNAYTWGIDQPYVVVLPERVVQELGADELDAILGHELGHILFEHVFLSSLMGSMLHPMGVGALWGIVFARWRRYAELTADRISLLVCGEVEVVVRTLIKVVYDATDKVIDVRAVLRRLYDGQQLGSGGHLGKLVPARGFVVARIRAVLDFDAELVALDVERWLTVDR